MTMRAARLWGVRAVLLSILVTVTLLASAGWMAMGSARTTGAYLPAPLSPVSPTHGPTPQPWSCHGIDKLGTPACGGATPALPTGPLAAAAPGWSSFSVSPPPQSIYDFEMTYDAADGYVVLLGSTAGNGGTEGPTSMWKYSGGSWSALTPAVLPMNCPGSAMAYDDADHEVVYFGGPNVGGSGLPACTSANETWTYHAGVWTQLFPTTSPPGRYGASLTNDSADGYLLLFGGEATWCTATYGWCGDTWKFSAGNWAQVTTTTHPSPRGEAGMAYDVKDGYVLLFGGTNTSGGLNDTWKFSSGAWTQLHPTVSPSVPTPDAFGYDTADAEIVYTTALNYSAYVSEITWTYTGGNWTHVTSAGPTERLGAGVADDPKDGYLLFFGGTGSTGLADSWAFHAGAWTNVTPPTLGPRYYAAEAYDPSTQQVILFGGTYYAGCCVAYANDTWSFNGTGWARVIGSAPPPARTQASLVYDAADGYLLLFGGYSNAGALNDTWEFAAGKWTQLTPGQSPPAVYGGVAAYDGADGYVLLFQGSAGGTWSYHAGVWSNLSKTAGTPPQPVAANPLVYDSTDGYVLFFGTSQPSLTNETWVFHGGKWTDLTNTAGRAPPAISAAALADYPTGGYVLLYEGTGTQDTWSFTNGTWSELFVPAGPSPRFGMAGAFDPKIAAAVFFGGSSTGCSGPSSTCGDTWFWSQNGSPSPLIRAFSATPATLDLGQTTTLSVSTLGGVGPLSFGYSSLPPGCGTSNTSSLLCTPSTTGSFHVVVSVTDSAKDVVTAATALVVNAALGVGPFAASPASLTVGGTTVLSATVTGGTSAFLYAYTGLPPGCASQTVPALPCTPTGVGNYSVTVTVTDAAGVSVSATTALTVVPAGGSTGPQVYSFAAVPAAIVLGNSTNISVDARGGVPPLVYAYAGLPAGCTSANVSTLVCTPTSAGTFTLTVSVKDSAGSALSVTTNFTVYPVGGGAGLTVSAFAATPGLVMVGQATVIDVLAAGGVGPIGYSYSNLPPGCAGSNVSSLPCQPSSAGNYSIHVTVFDAAGHRAGVRAALAVLTATGGVGPSISAFFVTPAATTVGSNVTIVVSVSAGTLPLTYVYAGLPGGCLSRDTPVVECVPTAAGNFSVTVHVTDALGRTVNASAPLSVAPARTVGPPGTSGASPSLFETPAGLTALAAVGVAVALALALILERRNRRRREGRALVRALETQPIEDGPDGPGA